MAFYTLDIKKTGRRFLAEGFRVGDNGIRKLYFHFTEGNDTYILPEASVATLFARLPDGSCIYDSCTVCGDTVIYSLRGGIGNGSLTALAGIVDCEIRITSKDGELLTSPRFSLLIEPVLQDDSAVEAHDSFSALTDALSRVLLCEEGLSSKVDRIEASAGNAVVFAENGAISDSGSPPVSCYVLKYDEDGTFDRENRSVTDLIKADIQNGSPFIVYIDDGLQLLPACIDYSAISAPSFYALYHDAATYMRIRILPARIEYRLIDTLSQSFEENKNSAATQKATAVWVKAYIDRSITEGEW